MKKFIPIFLACSVLLGAGAPLQATMSLEQAIASVKAFLADTGAPEQQSEAAQQVFRILNAQQSHNDLSDEEREVNMLHYTVLGVKTGASTDDIKRAYRRCLFDVNPDKKLRGTEAQGSATEAFKIFKNAYEVLSDTSKREHYDQSRMKGRPYTEALFESSYRTFVDHMVGLCLSDKELFAKLSVKFKDVFKVPDFHVRVSLELDKLTKRSHEIDDMSVEIEGSMAELKEEFLNATKEARKEAVNSFYESLPKLEGTKNETNAIIFRHFQSRVDSVTGISLIATLQEINTQKHLKIRNDRWDMQKKSLLALPLILGVYWLSGKAIDWWKNRKLTKLEREIRRFHAARSAYEEHVAQRIAERGDAADADDPREFELIDSDDPFNAVDQAAQRTKLRNAVRQLENDADGLKSAVFNVCLCAGGAALITYWRA